MGDVKRITQGRTAFEVDRSITVEGHVRLIGTIGSDGHAYTLTPETARALGEALIAQANEVDLKSAKFSVGDLVAWNGPAPSQAVVISSIKAKRSEDGDIEFFFIAKGDSGQSYWRKLNNYRHATPEDKKR